MISISNSSNAAWFAAGFGAAAVLALCVVQLQLRARRASTAHAQASTDLTDLVARLTAAGSNELKEYRHLRKRVERELGRPLQPDEKRQISRLLGLKPRTSKLDRRRNQDWAERKEAGRWGKRRQQRQQEDQPQPQQAQEREDEKQPPDVGSDKDSTADPDRLLRKAETVMAQRCCNRLVLVLERCTSLRNYTAVIRTAECMGIQNVWVIHPPKPDDMAAQPGGTGKKGRGRKERWVEDEAEAEQHQAYARQAMRWLHIRAFRTTEQCLAALRGDGDGGGDDDDDGDGDGDGDGDDDGGRGYTIWATDLSQLAVPLDELLSKSAPIPIPTPASASTSASASASALALPAAPLLPERLALVMGTESTGCSDAMLAAADRRVYLPMAGFADSLNLSVAAALVLQRILLAMNAEADAGAGGRGRANGDASAAQIASLRSEWYPLLARGPEQRALFEARIRNQQIPLPFRDLDVRRPDEHRVWGRRRRVERAEKDAAEMTDEQMEARAQLLRNGNRLSISDSELRAMYREARGLPPRPSSPPTSIAPAATAPAAPTTPVVIDHRDI